MYSLTCYRAEQEEYQAEGIKWTSIPFFNNRIVCELLDGARPAGVFRILDDTVKVCLIDRVIVTILDDAWNQREIRC